MVMREAWHPLGSVIVRYHHKWYGKFTRNWLFAQAHSHGMLLYSGVPGKLGEKRTDVEMKQRKSARMVGS